MSELKRQPHLDALRVYACIAVVVLHVSSAGVKSSHIAEASWHICNLYDGSVRWAVPVFVMISGSLFLASDKPLRAILRKKALRLALAFAFWSLVYAVSGLLKGTLNLHGFLYELIFGHYHMWYIPMLVGLYVLTPLLRQIARSDEHARLFLVLALVANFLLPQLASVLACFSELAGDMLTRFVNGFRLDFVLGYGTYYVLGYRLNRLDRQVSSVLLMLTFVAAVLVTVLGTWGICTHTGFVTEVMYGNMTVNVLACSVAVFLLARNQRAAAEGLLGNGLFATISRHSFGIYLVHPLVIEFLRDALGLDWSTFGAAVSVPLVTLVVVAISLAASVAVSKVPVLGRYVA